MKNNTLRYARELFKSYDDFHVADFRKRQFSPDILHLALETLRNNAPSAVKISPAGDSFERKKIYHVQTGTGRVPVLLWSQMHGDEPTATMAICDILKYFGKTRCEGVPRKILSTLTLHFIPMLNPDGATCFQRRNAQNIDINRDALALRTPEARLLRKIQKKLEPRFGFNLHDQELSSVGNSKTVSAMSLLAPAYDHERSDNPVRTRAKYLAATFNRIIQEYIPDLVTRYDDAFEARAFGDNMQKWGTSTLLVESGHLKDDPEKELIRKLNFVGILSTLYSIASGEYRKFDLSGYDKLPINGKRAYDVIIRNAAIKTSGTQKFAADLAVSYQVDTHSELPPKLVDMGDLRPYVGIKEINAEGKTIPQDKLRINEPFEWEKYF